MARDASPMSVGEVRAWAEVARLRNLLRAIRSEYGGHELRQAISEALGETLP